MLVFLFGLYMGIATGFYAWFMLALPGWPLQYYITVSIFWPLLLPWFAISPKRKG